MSLSPTARQPENAVSGDREERMKRFLATASHDLQSPLRHIAMYAEMLLDELDGTLDGEQLQSLKMIMEKAQTAQRLTKALMSLAGGTPQVTMGTVDLQSLAEIAFGGQAIARAIFARPDELRDLVGNLLVEAAGCDGDERHLHPLSKR